jgi:hypothetical protein
VKANLTREQLHAMHRGGVRAIQPGIESLSSHVLQLMRKGSTMLQNVRLLKWARYYNMSVFWNLLWGFPGETVEDYERELGVLRLLSHLQPPQATGRIWLGRFSPYFTEAEKFPVHDVRPEPSYRSVYPSHVALDKVAFYFEYAMDDTAPEDTHRAMVSWVDEWWQRWKSAEPDTLFYRRTLDGLFIDEHRGSEGHGTYTFDGPLALMYEHCGDTYRSVPQVIEHLQATLDGYQFSEREVHEALDEFACRGLMVTEDGRYLSLALPANPNW